VAYRRGAGTYRSRHGQRVGARWRPGIRRPAAPPTSAAAGHPQRQQHSEHQGQPHPPRGGADIIFDVCALQLTDINDPHVMSEAFLRSESSPLPDRQHSECVN